MIGLEIGKKRENIEAYKVPWWYEGIGLMFQRRERAKALLFEFDKPVKMAIHSFFVFFPFVALWLDGQNKIIDTKVVKPFEFRVLPSGKFTKLLEVPINGKYDFLNFRRTKERFK